MAQEGEGMRDHSFRFHLVLASTHLEEAVNELGGAVEDAQGETKEMLKKIRAKAQAVDRSIRAFWREP